MSDVKGTVVATIQSPGNDPVDVKWCTDGDALAIIQSVTQLLRFEDDLPIQTRTLSITINLS